VAASLRSPPDQLRLTILMGTPDDPRGQLEREAIALEPIGRGSPPTTWRGGRGVGISRRSKRSAIPEVDERRGWLVA